MHAKLTVCAEIQKPIDGASAIFLACLAYLKQMGIDRIEINGDGDIILTRKGKRSYVTPQDLPSIEHMVPMAEAI